MSSLDITDLTNAINYLSNKIDQLIRLFTPSLLVAESNKAVTANNSFNSLSPSYPVSSLRITVIVDTAGGTFSLVRRPSATITVTEALNAGVTLNANQEYILDVMATSDEVLSFQYSVNAKLLTFKVYEVPAMTNST